MKVLAAKLKHFLDEHRVCYRILNHERTASLSRAAQLLELNPAQVIQVVLLKDNFGFVLAALPLDTEIDLAILSKRMGRNFNIVPESECKRYFVDCEPGAYTLLGEAYGFSLVLDKSIENLKTLYLEAGCHTSMLQLSMHEFEFLTHGAPYFSFAIKKSKKDYEKEEYNMKRMEEISLMEAAPSVSNCFVNKENDKENLTKLQNVYRKVKDLIYN